MNRHRHIAQMMQKAGVAPEPAPDPISHWPINEGSGTAISDMGTGSPKRPGTANFTNWVFEDGIWRLSFIRGSDTTVRVPFTQKRDYLNFTITFKARSNSTATDQGALVAPLFPLNWHEQRVFLDASQSNLRLYMSTWPFLPGPEYLSPDCYIGSSDGTAEYFYSIGFDRNAFYCGANGSWLNSLPMTAPPGTLRQDRNRDMYIGTRDIYNPDTTDFGGTIRQVKIFDEFLTEGQLITVMNDD